MRIATRPGPNGVAVPAWKGAPPRTRQSDINRERRSIPAAYATDMSGQEHPGMNDQR